MKTLNVWLCLARVVINGSEINFVILQLLLELFQFLARAGSPVFNVVATANTNPTSNKPNSLDIRIPACHGRRLCTDAIKIPVF